MARPQRKNVDYFPHYISDGKKMYYIEQKYGNDGYASWFKILETLAKTDDHYINLNDQTELMFLAAKCRISEETLLNILTDLSKLGQINEEMWLVKIVWSDKFIESIQDAYSKRSNKCQSIEGLRVSLTSLGILKGVEKPQSKVKETKAKERKQKKVYPTIDEFVKYGNEKAKEIGVILDQFKLKAKYISWSENDWKTLGDKAREISNWKSTLTNSIEYLKVDEKSNNPKATDTVYKTPKVFN